MMNEEAEKDVFYQKIYDNGYKDGQNDADARFRIGRVFADKKHVRDLRAIQHLVRNNKNYSEDYRNGDIDAIDRYIGVMEFCCEVDKLAVRNTVEEQARIIRNRMEARYRESLENGKLDRKSYTQIIACIDAIYQELFFAGFNVGIGELIGPQKITVMEA